MLLWLILLTVVSVTVSLAEKDLADTFRFASHYGDHMVLQREPLRSVVWGFGEEDEKVELILSDGDGETHDVYTTTVKHGPNRTFVWRIELDPKDAGGPFKLVARSTVDFKRKMVSLFDVYFGDLWLCSGQSNMVFTVSMAFKAREEEALAGRYDKIRIFTVARVTSNSTVYEYPNTSILQNWSVASNDSIGGLPWQYFSAVCWNYGRKLYDKLNIPIGLISSDYGDTTIQAWSSPDALSTCGITEYPDVTPKDSMQTPLPSKRLYAHSVLWNAMIHPLLNTTIYGVIWYQAEANEHQPDLYKCMFPEMVADWRKKWHSSSRQTDLEFPFGFVQICNYAKNMSIIGTYPALRWAQTAGMGYVPNKYLPNTFMAVTIDLPDIESPFGPIHPRDKTDVSQRLYLGAMATAFGQNIQWTGPVVESVVMALVIPGLYAITVSYKKETVLNNGIEVRSRDGFEVLLSSSSTDESFLWKPVSIINYGFDYVILLVYVNNESTIVSVRYEWRNYPCYFKKCAVYNRDAELPSPPFNSTVTVGKLMHGLDSEIMTMR